ncbi:MULTISPECIES: hypothetical protein [Rhizobium/Agrobacterium group]|uniref:Phage tail protein n=1 Tax=Agrobacterium vitis TaxID=373 RepID=A0ABD6H9D6_AGRVI|nr:MULTISPECIES: hypothetical protein [Rhizobium/Agrobacterium group]MUO42187.1 hypothetical protein [Agrobacterium vitis]MUP10898.1 hypothetical protein [Agrobacterium vitis]
MDWEIFPFERMGPIRFGMTAEEVSAIVGAPDRSSRGLRPGSFNEQRGTKAPIVRYRENRVREIEAFYDLENVTLRGVQIFQGNGIDVLRQLEEMNGGASLSVGIVLFENIGVTTGRLDEEPRTGHSITAFATGTWNGLTDDFTAITFR